MNSAKSIGFGMSMSACCLVGVLRAQDRKTNPAPRDAVGQAPQHSAVQPKRPEQEKSQHDRSDVFDVHKAEPSSTVFSDQPKQGKVSGFDFYRDPLNSDMAFADPEDHMRKETAAKTLLGPDVEKTEPEGTLPAGPKLKPME